LELDRTGSTFIFATHLHEIVKMERIKKLTKVKAFHISVEYDAKTDSLVYDRKLKEGSGDTVYGITVARYILNDKDFINTALEIKEEITKSSNSLLSGKTSRYNSEVFVNECYMCHKKDTTGYLSDLQTHHINFQKDCVDGFSKNKPHIAKNSKANLVVICAECHDKVHHQGLDIDGFVMTSRGKQVVLKEDTQHQVLPKKTVQVSKKHRQNNAQE
jgi:DNA mismatch repair protein MutS